jgi:hypothetical protein
VGKDKRVAVSDEAAAGLRQFRGPVEVRARVSGVSERLLAALDAAADEAIPLRSARVTRERRLEVRAAALHVMAGVGIGGMSGVYGPAIRHVLVSLLSRRLGGRTVTTFDVTADELRAVLAKSTFRDEALKILDGSAKDGPNGIRTVPAASLAPARDWLRTGMHEAYYNAVTMVMALGGQIHFEDVTMSCDGALAMAFKRHVSSKKPPEPKPAKKGKPARPWIFYQAPVRDNPYCG